MTTLAKMLGLFLFFLAAGYAALAARDGHDPMWIIATISGLTVLIMVAWSLLEMGVLGYAASCSQVLLCLYTAIGFGGWLRMQALCAFVLAAFFIWCEWEESRYAQVKLK